MNVLVCGHRSFVAQGIVPLLRQAGHEVTTFSRGPVAQADNAVTGPVALLHENPHLAGKKFDTVINYILVKDDTVESNIAYMESLSRFCVQAGVKHLIHLSSISSYKASLKVIDEQAAIETDPNQKGAYGAPKVATDLYLINHLPAQVKLSLVRPGFVLGKGVTNPIVGTAARLPWNRLLVIGNGRSAIPITTRELVHKAVMKMVQSPPQQQQEVIVLADPASPTRVEFLELCCKILGTGRGVTSLPVWFWWSAAVGGEIVARLIGQGGMRPYNKLTARLARQRFDSARSAARLGLDMRVDLPAALLESLSDQQPNAAPPYEPADVRLNTAARDIAFIGFGRIVKQKHLPALKKLGYSGAIRAFDLQASKPPGGIEVKSIDGAALGKSDLFVVASPGPAHVKAIEPLRQAKGPVLIEKPLCYNSDELSQWIDFAGSRADGVYVCHNYRYKRNVREMLEVLRQHNPGRLDHVALHFQSPSVSADSAPWMRDERRARTLLLDYALHFVDLACMFNPAGQPWSIDSVRHKVNDLGQTSLIEGHLSGEYTVSLLLKQGFAPRRARLLFSFQNYSLSLGFFPDTFVPHLADDNAWLHKAEAKISGKMTRRKVIDKLMNRDSDDSHAVVIAASAAQSPAIESLSVARLEPFYRTVFGVAQRVYG